MAARWQIAADTGGTFTDVLAIAPDGSEHRAKVLSSGCLRAEVAAVHGTAVTLKLPAAVGENFLRGFTAEAGGASARVGSAEAGGRCELESALPCAPGDTLDLRSSEEAPVLGARLATQTPGDQPLPPMDLRLATTRGTNALLEDKGAPVAFFVSRGFGDLLEIGDQRRPDLFELAPEKRPPLTQNIIEVAERMDARGNVVAAMDPEALDAAIEQARERGAEVAAVALLHSTTNPAHEKSLAERLRGRGFAYVAASHELSDFVKLLPRAETTVVDATLGPILRRYLDQVAASVSGQLRVMTSAGGLTAKAQFRPKDSLLSGPAGGVKGARAAGLQAGFARVLAFDMGGTSTDVSRIEEIPALRSEHRVGSARILAPALPIETVAAGGGSICGWNGRELFVGPDSAGADPGPACYGRGGPLSITDVHLLLGRLQPDGFNIPIDPSAAEARIRELEEKLQRDRGALLEGFLDLANQRMAHAIRQISVREGYDPGDYALIAFGGAGGLHACRLAEELGCETVLAPADAGILSAFGLQQASLEHVAERQLLQPLADAEEALPQLAEELETAGRRALIQQGAKEDALEVRARRLRLRMRGQETPLSIDWTPEGDGQADFAEAYRKIYGYSAPERPLEVVSLQVLTASVEAPLPEETFAGEAPAPNAREVTATFEGQAQKVPVYHRADLAEGTCLPGPALVVDPFSATVIEPGWQAGMGSRGTLRMTRQAEKSAGTPQRDALVERDLIINRFRQIVGEMGEQLQRTALSVNVKERLDFSCALLDPQGQLVANAPHIPVHLGALGTCVRAVAERLTLAPGDVVVTNHPALGGSHLPDVTVITPVFDREERLLGYCANRAHHAEIGGKWPGSMPPDGKNLAEEGVVIEPTKLIEGGTGRWETLEAQLQRGPWPSRAPDENLADLRAQVAANQRGAEALRALANEIGAGRVEHFQTALQDLADEALDDALARLPGDLCEASQTLDDGTKISATLRRQAEGLSVSFEGTSPAHPGNLNATQGIVRSALIYVLRLLANADIPLNDGLLRRVELALPEGFLNPAFQGSPEEMPAVVGGNVETSQRLVDTLLRAFEVAAASQGTMNNLVFGNDALSFYETLGGGAGATPECEGADALHVHMTNTAITDPEIIERRFPVRLREFAVRRGSGGNGTRQGGDGICREIEFLEPMTLSLLTQRRKSGPYGLNGGEDGAPGRQFLIRANGQREVLPGQCVRELSAGDALRLETPGGGGCGGTV